MARWAGVPPIRIETVSRTKRRLGQLLLAAALLAAGAAAAQEDKKTDDDKPADPDTGESTVEEKTLGLLPNPFQKYGVKFAATYIGEVLGNPSGAGTDEAGHAFQFEAGRVFRSEAGHPWRQSHGSI
jgi:hypothetical protein